MLVNVIFLVFRVWGEGLLFSSVLEYRLSNIWRMCVFLKKSCFVFIHHLKTIWDTFPSEWVFHHKKIVSLNICKDFVKYLTIYWRFYDIKKEEFISSLLWLLVREIYIQRACSWVDSLLSWILLCPQQSFSLFFCLYKRNLLCKWLLWRFFHSFWMKVEVQRKVARLSLQSRLLFQVVSILEISSPRVLNRMLFPE